MKVVKLNFVRAFAWTLQGICQTVQTINGIYSCSTYQRVKMRNKNNFFYHENAKANTLQFALDYHVTTENSISSIYVKSAQFAQF